MSLRTVPCTAGRVAASRTPQRTGQWMAPVRLALALVGLGLIAGLASACSVPPRLPPVPADETEQVSVVPGVPNARFWADTQVPAMVQEAQRALGRERAELGLSAEDALPRVDFLALSGGSDDGAFGAGLLIGWTEAGTRPEFKLVTGVSTGALIAPFAFLGPSHDEQLRQVYTAIGPKDVFSRRDLIMLPWDDAVTDTRPLSQADLPLCRRTHDDGHRAGVSPRPL